MEYYIYITNDCNMNCAYCSVLFDTAKYCVPLNPQYSFEDLERFITKTQRDYKDKENHKENPNLIRNCCLID